MLVCNINTFILQIDIDRYRQYRQNNVSFRLIIYSDSAVLGNGYVSILVADYLLLLCPNAAKAQVRPLMMLTMLLEC